MYQKKVSEEGEMMDKIDKAIVNANVVLENGIIWDGVILIAKDKIAQTGKAREVTVPEECEIIDAQGSYVGPGFVDIHVHGGNNGSTCFQTVETAEFFLRHGSTSILATPSYSFDLDTLMKSIREVKAAMNKARTVKGLYLEGPYTNPRYGSHSYENPWRHPIDPQEYRQFVDEAGKLAVVWTIAPEREGIEGFVEYARKVNPDTIFAIGHSEATPAQIRRLGKYRPRIQTHSMCATGRLKTYGGTRDFGPDEYCFKEPDVYTEMISDSCGVHVNPEMQQLLLHNKGIHRTILITDSTVHDDPAPPHLAHVTDLNFDANGGIAGSKLTMDQACRNVMAHTNCGIAQAFVMSSTTPARAIGLGDEIGSVESGKQADLVFVNDRFEVEQVMLGGEICRF